MHICFVRTSGALYVTYALLRCLLVGGQQGQFLAQQRAVVLGLEAPIMMPSDAIFLFVSFLPAGHHSLASMQQVLQDYDNQRQPK